jgi:hypothetical protein
MRAFDSWTDDDLRAALRKLEAGLLRGVAEVEHNGERVRYSTPSAIREAISEIRLALRARIADEAGAAAGPARIVYISTRSRGL